MEVNSTMMPLGTNAPKFTLPIPKGKRISLDEFKGKKALVVIFMCNHCPFVKHIKSELISFANDYMPRDVGIIGINSNNWKEYPDDSPDKMDAENYPFPYAYDESQDVAKAYKAACTPDFYLFDADFKLAYCGQFDDSRPGNDVSVTGKDLRAATDALLKGKPVNPDQRPSSGCNIKWKAGNEPAYFG